MKKGDYKIIGRGPYGIAEREGGVVYDLIDSKEEATKMNVLMNAGIGPEWDKLEPFMQPESGGAK